MQAEQFLVAANADIGAAKALFFPTISLTGFLGGVSGDLTTFLGGSGGVWSVGAGLLQPIFQGGRLRRNLEAAQARFDAALARVPEGGAQRLPRGRQRAGDDPEAGARCGCSGRWASTALQDAADLSRARYESGLASYIEILTADQELFEQQLLLAQTRGAELRARAELYRDARRRLAALRVVERSPYYAALLGRVSPSFAMRVSSVVGFRSSSSAAPSLPVSASVWTRGWRECVRVRHPSA